MNNINVWDWSALAMYSNLEATRAHLLTLLSQPPVSTKEMVMLCYDHFPTVYATFKAKNTLPQMVEALLVHCDQQPDKTGAYRQLLEAIATTMPPLYKTWQREFTRWQQSAKTYREAILNQYGTLKILGKSEPVPLENIFTDVFILDKPTASRRFDFNKLQTEVPIRLDTFDKTTPERVNGLELVKQGKRLYILGKPGAGKTTFLKYIATQCVKFLFPNLLGLVDLYNGTFCQDHKLRKLRWMTIF